MDAINKFLSDYSVELMVIYGFFMGLFFLKMLYQTFKSLVFNVKKLYGRNKFD